MSAPWIQRRFLSSLLGRFVLSYAVLLLVPLIATGLVVNGRYYRVYYEELLSAHHRSLLRITEVGDASLRQLSETAFMIARSAPVLRFPGSPTPVTAQKLIALLRTLRVTSEIVHEVLVSFEGHPYVYGSSSSYTPQTLSRIYPLAVFRADGTGAQRLAVATAYANEWTVLPTGDRQRFVVIVYPLSAEQQSRAIGTVTYLIDAESLGRLLLGNRPTAHLSICAGQVPIVSIGTIAEPSVSTLVVRHESASGLRYELTVPARLISEKLRRIRLGFLMTVATVVVVGGILIAIFARMSYGPIDRLQRYVSSRMPLSGVPGTTVEAEETIRPRDVPTELSSIRTTFDRALAEMVTLKAKLGYAVDAVRERLIFQLLQGRIPTAQSIELFADETGLHLDSPFYAAAVVLVQPAGSEDIRDDVLHWFEGVPEPRVFGRLLVQQHRIILVLGSKRQDGPRDVLEALRAEAEGLFGVRITIGLGSSRPELSLLPRSAIEASAALDYCIIVGTGSVISYRDVAGPHEFRFPTSEIAALRAQLEARDAASVRRTVERLVTRLKSERPSLAAARTVHFAVIDAVVELVDRLGGVVRPSLPDVFAVAAIGTLDELADGMASVCEAAFRALADSRPVSGMLREALDAVQQGFFDASFSVQSLADSLSVSTSMLTELFRKEIGTTPLAYINELRHERARQYLSTTRLPLKQVVHAVGYGDVSSFIRRFKEIEGITPGEYRRLYYGP